MFFDSILGFRRALAPGGSFLLPHSSRFIALSAALVTAFPSVVLAQDATPVLPTENAPTSPEAAPSTAENAAAESAATENAAVETAPATSDAAPEIIAPAGSTRDLPLPAAPVSRLEAENISKNGDLIVAEGTAEKPVRFETTAGTISAVRIQLDVAKQVVEASGAVRLERQIQNSRRLLLPRGVKPRRVTENATETLVGQNLRFDFKTGIGSLDSAQIQLATLSISAQSLSINGRRYSAKNVVVRPGSMSPEDVKIYGTPPLNLRAKSLEATLGTTENAGAAGNAQPAVTARGGALYFRNTRILPLPGYVFRAGIGGGGGGESTFKLTPGISFNSADRVLLTTRLSYPLSKIPGGLSSFADIGLSQRIGVRGGIGLESNTRLGSLILRARRADIVETQLTNRIELDRKPEITYETPPLFAFNLPGNRRAGLVFSSSYGDYGERRIGDNQSTLNATRLTSRLLFSTRLRATDGPFLRLFSSTSRYGGIESRYRNTGFELGYAGQIGPRINGQIALRSTNLSGQTPFRFDRVEIARELRTTFDVALTPRYLLPVDLRYDLNRRTFRDASFGILRSYKIFAYGLVYQTARQDLRLEVRQGF